MKLTTAILSGLTAIALAAGHAAGQWVQFSEETSLRLITDDPDVGIGDGQERAFAWGDVNKNGRIDLVVVRKQPFSTAGTRRNVLFMNEGMAEGWDVDGVLVDRTAEYVTESDIEGDMGFLTPTNDRKVELIDVNGNGWLDMVTVTTLSACRPKHISHPRVYINLGEVDGVWQGFRYEDFRMPQLGPTAPSGFPFAPNFCGIGVGDVTGNGLPDIYFSDYSGHGSGPPCNDPTFDFNDMLLVNQGDGTFVDESTRIPSTWLESNFGVEALIADLNGNNINDIVKLTTLGPYHVRAMYNDPGNVGTFNQSHIVWTAQPYFIREGDLNNNGRLDLVVADDGRNKYFINLGNDSNGMVIWGERTLDQASSGFRSSVRLADLNKNGWLDMLIADVDVDIPGCSRTSDMFRSNANGENVSFTRDYGNIPQSLMRGVYDFAVFDLTGNGWPDIIAARCDGYNIWINQPTFGVDFTYPNGRPPMIEPETETAFPVQMQPFGGSIEPGTATLYVSTNGRSFTPHPMDHLGGDLYEAVFPELPCGDNVSYYISVEMSSGQEVTDPPTAPQITFSTVVAAGLDVVLEEDVEGNVSNWTIVSDESLTSGEWEQAVPTGIICCGGQLAQPDGDASPDPDGKAFITENCEQGEPPLDCSVAGGPTYLISPSFDLEGTGGIITYDRWFFCSTAGDPDTADFLTTEISNDGGQSWVFVHATGGTSPNWENVSFNVADFATPSANMKVRFGTADIGNNSITNAAIDNVLVERFTCEEDTCPWDLTGDGVVDGADLGQLLAAWGPCDDCDNCPADFTGDCEVTGADLGQLLANWGACP